MEIHEVLEHAGEELRAAWASTPPPEFRPKRRSAVVAISAGAVVVALFLPLMIFVEGRPSGSDLGGDVPGLERPVADPDTTMSPNGAWNRQQSAIEACMADAGFEYVPSLLVEHANGDTAVELFFPCGGRDVDERLASAAANGFGMYDWYTGYQVPPDSDPSAGDANDAALAGMTPAERGMYQAALEPCVRAAEATHPMSAISLDPRLAELVDQLSMEIMDVLDEHPAVGAARLAYADCMAEAGFPVGGEPVQSWLQARFEAVVGVSGSEARGAFAALDEEQRNALIEEECAAAVADVHCSVPLEEVWDRIGMELEAEYLSAHPELGG